MKKPKRILALVLSAAMLCGILPSGISAGADSAPGNIELSRQAATEGMVLLKNDSHSLPLASGTTVALFGKGQIDFVKGGGGSGDVNAEYVRNLLQGMQIKENEQKIEIYKPLADAYTANSNLALTDQMVANAKAASDTAIVVIRRTSGEGSDRSASKGDYYLSDDEVTMLNKVTSAGFQNIVVVLNIGGIMDTSWIASYPAIKSVLLAWQPGMEGGLAVADILCGDVNPSGKLADTFAKSYDDYPSSKDFNESEDYVNYTEDIYVGYRWFETFDPNYTKVNYEFGYGLSYTTFSINNVKTSVEGANIKVTADVKNTGTVAGKEVVQVYFSAPQGKLGKPAKELAAFAKTKLLAPGETETLTMTYAINDMSSYDDTGKVQKSAYVLEAGDYKIYVGNSVKNAGQNGVRYTYKVNSTTVTEQLTEQAAPNLLPKRLLADGSYETLTTPDNFGYDLPSDGSVYKIEAENYFKKHYHAHVSFSDNADLCGMELYTSDSGNRWLRYAVNAENPGAYQLTLAASNGGATVNDAINVYVNGLIQNGISLNITNTGGKWSMREFSSVTVNLSKGLNMLQIEFKKGDAYTGIVDYIKLKEGGAVTEVPGPYHTIAAGGANVVEAEEFSTKTDDVGIEDITAGDAVGGKSLKNLHTKDYFVSYALDVAEAGTYDVSMQIANGLTATSDGCKVYVDQVQQSNFLLAVPITSVSGNQWFNFQTFEPGSVTLPAGKCVLTFVVNDRMGNLDKFTLTKAGAQAASAKTYASAGTTSAVAAVSSSPIMLIDVYNNPDLMDAFVAQLTDLQLADLSHGNGATIPNGTGGIGGLPEYGIPSAETADGPAGIRLGNPCTAWPVSTLLACTWNTELLEEVGMAVAKEAKLNGVDIWLAPGMNIHRNPLCGRNFEYYSEDPFVSGKMAAAITKGVQSEKVGITIKHFVANERETARGYSDSRVSERALREIYLKGFEIAIKESDPWCVMSSYNNLNGVETSESYSLLTVILRQEWGYKGMVMSDWWNDSTAYREVIAGDDVKMASGDTPNVMGALKAGLLTRAELERNVKNILTMIMKTGAMDRDILNPESHKISGSGTTRIKSIDYTWKSSGIGMENCEDTDGGYNPTNTYEGNWLRYNIDVEKAGVYKVTARVASEGGSGKANVLIDNQLVGTITNQVSTGGWQKWTTTPEFQIAIPDGKHDLKLEFIQGGWNVNWLEFQRVATSYEFNVTPDAPRLRLGDTKQFKAAVVGSSILDTDVVWSVSGGTSSSISDTGLLTIGADEASSTLVVKAVSKIDSKIFDTTTVTVFSLLPGDVDGNGTVDASDVVELRSLILTGNASADQTAAGDLDHDTKLTVDDVALLLEQLDILPGDVDGNGKADALDIMIIRKLLLNGTPTDRNLAAGDLDNDGKLNAVDIMKLRKLLLQQ